MIDIPKRKTPIKNQYVIHNGILVGKILEVEDDTMILDNGQSIVFRYEHGWVSDYDWVWTPD